MEPKFNEKSPTLQKATEGKTRNITSYSGVFYPLTRLNRLFSPTLPANAIFLQDSVRFCNGPRDSKKEDWGKGETRRQKKIKGE